MACTGCSSTTPRLAPEKFEMAVEVDGRGICFAFGGGAGPTDRALFDIVVVVSMVVLRTFEAVPVSFVAIVIPLAALTRGALSVGFSTFSFSAIDERFASLAVPGEDSVTGAFL